MLHKVYSNRFQVSNANTSDTFVYINIKIFTIMDDKRNNFEFDTVLFYLFIYLFIYFLHFAGDY